MLVKSHLLLVGPQIDAATIEISVENFPEDKNKPTEGPSYTNSLTSAHRTLYPTVELLAHLCLLQLYS